MDALLFSRKEARYVAAMAAARIKPGAGASVGPLKLTQLDPPDLPGDGWEHISTRLAGICGSDLATIDGQASRYFEPLASFPFVPGHEIVGERADGTAWYLNLYLDQKPEVKSQLGLEQRRQTVTTTDTSPPGTSSQVYKPVLVQALGAAGQKCSPLITASSIPSQMI